MRLAYLHDMFVVDSTGKVLIKYLAAMKRTSTGFEHVASFPAYLRTPTEREIRAMLAKKA